MYEVADVQVWAYLGLHLAEKLRGAVALQTYRAGGEREDQRQRHRATCESAGRTGTKSSTSPARSIAT